MKATFMMVGLVALIGCGAEENNDPNAASPAKTTAGLTAAGQSKGVDPAATTEEAAPRGARFAMSPAGGLSAGSVASKVWSRDDRPILPEAGAAVVGQFDPAQAARVEADRLRLQPFGGVK